MKWYEHVIFMPFYAIIAMALTGLGVSVYRNPITWGFVLFIMWFIIATAFLIYKDNRL